MKVTIPNLLPKSASCPFVKILILSGLFIFNSPVAMFSNQAAESLEAVVLPTITINNSVDSLEAVVFPTITIVQSDTHEISNIGCVVEYTGSSIWLHLVAPNNFSVIASAFVMNSIEPINEEDLVNYENQFPPLLKDYANEFSVKSSIDLDLFDIVWNESGNAATLLYNGGARAMVVSNKNIGYSIGVSQNCPYARAWNRKLFARIFKNLILNSKKSVHLTSS